MSKHTRSSYSDETKAAVMAALLAGQSVSSIAAEYEIPKGTVSGWKKIADRYFTPSEQATTQKSAERVGELIIDLLTTELETLKSMAGQFADPAWIAKQDAADIGVLYGIIQDKVFRKLEALTRAASD